jgi:Bacterial Ig-like domain (group 2)
MANGMHRIRRAGHAGVAVMLGIVCSAVLVGCGGRTPPTSPSLPTAPNQPPQGPTSLRVSGNQSLDAVGETSQLTATATYKDGTSTDVTASTYWWSQRETVATVSPSGLVTAVGFGTAKIMATYMLSASVDFTVVAPPGTFFARGWVHEPGAGEGLGLGVPGVRVREPQSGLSTVTDALGHYFFGGLTGHHLILDKEDYEQAEFDTTGCESTSCEKNVRIQRVFRINAGEVVTPTPLAPNDIEYIVGSDTCDHCRRVRVVCPVPGTLRLRLTWNKPESRLNLWVDGGRFQPGGDGVGEVIAEVPVSAGEVLVYAGLTEGSVVSGRLPFSLATLMIASQ